MQQNKTSVHGVFSILVISIIGDNMVIGLPEGTGRDIWVSLLISLVLCMPIVLMYGRMVTLLPGKNIYEMAEYAFGHAGSVIVSIVFGFFCYGMASVMLFSFSTFTNMISLVRTDFYIIVFLFILAASYLAHQGASTLGKWALIIFIAGSVTVLVIFFFASDIMNFRNLLPAFHHPFPNILSSGIRLAVLPILHIVVTMGISDSFEIPGKATRLYALALTSAVLYLMIIFIRICCTLGAEMMNTAVFQNFRSVSLVSISDFFERIEGIVLFVYLMTGIAQVAVCLLSISNSAKNLLKLHSHKTLLIPISVLVFATAQAPFDNIIAMFDFLDLYYFISFPFQILLPLVIWIAVEVKHKKKGRENTLQILQDEINQLEKGLY